MSLTRVVCSTQALRALIDRLDYEGTVEFNAFDQGRARLDWFNKLEQTPLDVLDERHKSPNWPPDGRWELDADGNVILPGKAVAVEGDTPPQLPEPVPIKTVAVRKSEEQRKKTRTVAAKRRRATGKTTGKVATVK